MQSLARVGCRWNMFWGSPIERRADGATRVFGPAVEAAVFQAPDGTLSAEAYYSKVSPGGLTGKRVLSLRLGDGTLVALRYHTPERKMLRMDNVRLKVAARDVEPVGRGLIRG